MEYRESRRPCRYDVTFDMAGRPARATIVNVSRTGGYARGDFFPLEGDTMRFTLLGMPVGVVVTRSTRGGNFAFSFDRPLDNRQLDTIRGGPARRH